MNFYEKLLSALKYFTHSSDKTSGRGYILPVVLFVHWLPVKSKVILLAYEFLNGKFHLKELIVQAVPRIYCGGKALSCHISLFNFKKQTVRKWWMKDANAGDKTCWWKLKH